MATAILIVVAVILALACIWFEGDNRRLRQVAKCDDAIRFLLEQANERMRRDLETEKSAAFDRGRESVLERLKDKAQKESVFDRDTIQPMVSRRYTPIAVRRAMAERESMGPVTHDAKVRENNARAIESAG